MDEPIRLLDPSLPDVRLEFAMAEAEILASSLARATARQMQVIAEALAEARRHPEVLLDPAESRMLSAVDACRYAESAVVADLATRLAVAEGTVRIWAHQADALMRALPRTWSLFRDGGISVPNARFIADRVDEVPAGSWFELDARVVPIASLAPARFQTQVRTLVEALRTEPLVARHRRAAEKRRVCLERDRDGMTWFSVLLTDESAARADAHVDAVARELARSSDETRTLDQLRADVAADLLTSRSSGVPAVSVTIAVTVPVLTLLGHGDEPGALEGGIPIDADTARRLAGHAPSFSRILTHPISATVLDVDRSTYRVPTDLKRWLRVRDQTCVFVGCGRRASATDLDHTVAWADGGPTAARNLACLCERHHRLKHLSRWRVTQDAHGVTWTSPTGRVHPPRPRAEAPPPF
jgi:hypothetical protein